jgi:hypothetical protein
VLAQLDRALVEAGHRSIVIAPEGSRVHGELRPIPRVSGTITDDVREVVLAGVREILDRVVAADRPDVVHLHGIDFHAYLPPPGVPVMATLHLPLSWYPAYTLRPERAATWLHPISASQARAAPPGSRLAEPIENGVALPSGVFPKCGFAASLGRICPEKGVDNAIDACAKAGVPLLVAGQVFPYPEHQRDWREDIQPRLDRDRRWVGAVGGRAKQRLLGSARCVLVPSKAPETSSLVSMEALASGTP